MDMLKALVEAGLDVLLDTVQEGKYDTLGGKSATPSAFKRFERARQCRILREDAKLVKFER